MHNTFILKVYKFLVRLAKTRGLLIKSASESVTAIGSITYHGVCCHIVGVVII